MDEAVRGPAFPPIRPLFFGAGDGYLRFRRSLCALPLWRHGGSVEMVRPQMRTSPGVDELARDAHAASRLAQGAGRVAVLTSPLSAQPVKAPAQNWRFHALRMGGSAKSGYKFLGAFATEYRSLEVVPGHEPSPYPLMSNGSVVREFLDVRSPGPLW
jgi:hypothetical protein